MRFTDSDILGKFTGDTYERQLDAVREAVADPALSAEDQVERKCDWLVRELDELCKMANNPETRDLVAAQSIAVGQIQFRAGLILSFLAADKAAPLRIVR